MVVAVFGVIANPTPDSAPGRSQDVYALLAHCDVDESGFISLPLTRKASTVARLSNSVRRVAVIHKCDHSCVTGSDEKIYHGNMTLCDGQFFAFGRREGYPPRRS